MRFITRLLIALGLLWAVPASAQTTIFTDTFSLNTYLTSGYAVAEEITATTGDSLGEIAVSFYSGAAGLNILDAYYCIAATAPSCAAPPVQLKFSGNAGIAIPTYTITQSDFVAFAPAGTHVIVCFDIAPTGGYSVAYDTPAGVNDWEKGGPDCATQTKSGYGESTATDYAVTLIQTTAGASGALNSQPMTLMGVQ